MVQEKKSAEKTTKEQAGKNTQSSVAKSAGEAAVSDSQEATFISGLETEDGQIKISENVIAAVVRRYVLEVEGVVRFASPSIVSGLAEMIGRRNQEGSVVVKLEGDAVNIAVTLILEFGVKIPEVAELVQNVIRSRVEELTGKHVTSVDVIVQDLEEPGTEEEKQTGEQAAS
ncbi:MAG: Asp23/Gls24 family envelope stress response protein [Verrucomicrobiota bacterium]